MTRLAQQIGGSVGTAITVTLFDRAFATRQSGLAAEITYAQSPVASFAASRGVHAIDTLAAKVAQQALILASAATTLFFAVITALAVFLPLLFTNPLRKKRA